MGNNPIPNTNGPFIQLANNMSTGLTQLGATLGITQITPEAFQGYITAFVNADNDFNTARSDRHEASDNYRTATKALARWLEVVRLSLAQRFGNRWSTAWAQAGFINNSTKVPDRLADQMTLGQQLVSFFTANPSYELPQIDVTAAQGTTLTNAVLTAQQARNDAKTTSKTTKDLDATARLALAYEMRLLIQILTKLLGPDDPRWNTFGLNMPSANTTPGQPVNVAASLDASGNILVSCDAVPLATRYRWRMLLVDVDNKYSLAARTVAPLGVIKGVQPGLTVQIIVQAVNVTQQGVASEPIQFTVPPVAAALAAVEPHVKSAVTAVAKGNGNGHGNGKAHAVASRVK